MKINIEKTIEIEAIRSFRRIIRAQSLASYKGAGTDELIRIANVEMIKAVRDFDQHTTAAIPAEKLHNRILQMLSDAEGAH